MTENKFRNLNASEIDVRVQSARKNGVILLLYKDARCDMNILDETVGSMNWQRKHLRDNQNCIVSLWDADKKLWIEKEDTGSESNTEKEKGLASDSFKRACFNWGIGRELYTAPFIWVGSESCTITEYQPGKFSCNDKFEVSEIETIDGKINNLSIISSKTGKIVFSKSSGSAGTVAASAASHGSPSGEEEKCPKCGAPMKLSLRGTKYCSALCWKNQPAPDKVEEIVIPDDLPF
jgi:hypothetical protein